MADAGSTGIRLRVLRGVFWSCASFAGARILVLLSTSVLARLLAPRDFGLVGLALIFTIALDAVRDIGVNQALVVTDDAARGPADSAFWLSVAIGVALATALAALSPLVASVLDQPRLLALVSVLGLTLPLRSLGLTHYTLAQRDLDFRQRTIADLAEVVIRGGLAIALAIAGAGAWSLVGGYLSGTLAWTIVLWTQVHWRPTLRVRLGDLRPMIRFGGGLTAVGIIGMGMGYVDNLFVGAVLGPSALGIYGVAYRVPETFIVDVLAAVGLVLFPAFSIVGRNVLRGAVLAASRYAALVSLPMVVILITLADPLVLALFGPRWHSAARVIQVLSVGFAGWPLGQVAGNAYLAAKRVDVMVKLAVPQGLLLVVLIALFVHEGIVAVAACQTAVRVLFVAIGVYVSTRVLGFRARDLWRAVSFPLLAAGGMAVAIVALDQVVQPTWPRLISGCLVGGLTYAVLMWLLAREIFDELGRLAVGAITSRSLGPHRRADDARAESVA